MNQTRSRSSASLALVFGLSAVMLALEMLFPLALFYLPDRSGVTTIIAIVMLGLGAGGIVYHRLHLRADADLWVVRMAAALPYSILAAFMAAALLPGWTLRVIFLAAPFCFISVYLSRAFVELPPGKTYFFNLLGSAAGGIFVFVAQPQMGEENAILAAAAAAAFAAVLAVKGNNGKALMPAALLSAALACGALLLNIATERLDLSRLIPSARVPHERAGDALSFAFRAAKTPSAERLGVKKNLVSRVEAYRVPDYDVSARFFDGGWRAIGDPEFQKDVKSTLGSPVMLYYMDHLWSQVVEPDAEFSHLPPYNLLDKPTVLVIGPGGGVDIARAAAHQARRIVAVEINPGIIALMRGPLHKVSGGVYDKAEIVNMDGRTYVMISREDFDLIHLAFADLYVPFRNSDIFMENYLYTAEAMDDYFGRLAPGGILSIHKWVRSASWNKDLFRIAATVRAMLENRGEKNPGDHVFIAGMEGLPDQYLGYFLVKKTPFTAGEVTQMSAAVKAPLQVYYAPGIETSDNPFKRILDAPDFSAYLDSLPQDISPTTDDRPLFYLFDRHLFMHWGYFALFIAVTAVFIGAPFYLISRREKLPGRPGFAAASAFFAVIGIAYMFLQTTLLQKFNLFLGSPTLSLALTLITFLILGGVGARFSARLRGRARAGVILFAAAVALLYSLFGDAIIAACIQPSLLARSLITIGLLAPLCLALGFPFPMALDRAKASIGDRHAALFFAVNGAAGSFAVAAFTLCLPLFGLQATMTAGAVLYFLAAVIFTRLPRAGE